MFELPLVTHSHCVRAHDPSELWCNAKAARPLCLRIMFDLLSCKVLHNLYFKPRYLSCVARIVASLNRQMTLWVISIYVHSARCLFREAMTLFIPISLDSVSVPSKSLLLCCFGCQPISVRYLFIFMRRVARYLFILYADLLWLIRRLYAQSCWQP